MQILETATLFTYIILMSDMNTWLCFGFVCFLSSPPPFFFLICWKAAFKIKVISSWTQICIMDRFILLRWRTYFNSVSLNANGSSSVLGAADKDCNTAYISVLLKCVTIFIKANNLGALFVVSSMLETMRQIVD